MVGLCGIDFAEEQRGAVAGYVVEEVAGGFAALVVEVREIGFPPGEELVIELGGVLIGTVYEDVVAQVGCVAKVRDGAGWVGIEAGEPEADGVETGGGDDSVFKGRAGTVPLDSRRLVRGSKMA